MIIKAIETHISTNGAVSCDDCTYENDGWCITRVFADALKLLQEQEPVVHCKDCIHADISASGLIKCQGRFRQAEWYCADGKKQERK